MRWLQLCLILIALPLMAACSLNKVSTYPLEVHGAYTLDGGDVVRISVYGDDSISRSYKVDQDGTINFPLVGPVKVTTLSTAGSALMILESA